MKAQLKVKNFGPIKDLDIEIRKFNILIGPHASGKSTLSKVLCIINFFDANKIFPQNDNYNIDIISKQLAFYRLEKFLTKSTYWSFQDSRFSFELKNNKISIENSGTLHSNGEKSESYYFPAERVALPMISESLFELTLEQSTIPGYFLKFGRDFSIARKNQRLFNLPILNVEFEHADGKNVVTLQNNKSLLLEETSSAIQANLPLLVILQYPINAASLFVIEELELHGYPKLQKELLYYIVKNMKHPKLSHAYVVLPTHSPYILSAANNLLFAAKVGKQSKELSTKANEIIDDGSWIDKDQLSAFYIKDGKANSIFNSENGLIDENELDGISEDLAEEFDALMDIYKPVIA